MATKFEIPSLYRSQTRLSEELASSWIQNPSKILKDTPQATVSPRVMGHEIHKPKIRLARLDMSALNGISVSAVNQDEDLPDQDSSVDTTANQDTTINAEDLVEAGEEEPPIGEL